MEPEGIDALRERLAASRVGLLRDLAHVDEARFRQQPDPQSWSVAQVLEHLVRVEERVTRGARAILEGRVPPAPPGQGQRPESVLDRSVRFQAPPFAEPAGVASRAELMERLESARRDYLVVLESTRGRDCSNLRMAHPFLGTLTLDDMFAFVAYHEERHRSQIVEALERIA